MALSKEKIFEFLQNSSTPLTKREIARAFGVKGGENRVALKQILKSLENDGSIVKMAGGTFTMPEGLPPVSVIEICEIDIDGDVIAKPLEWNEELKGKPPRIEVMPDKKNYRNLHEGSRALARLSWTSENIYEARIMRLIDEGSRYEGGEVIGLVRLLKKGAILQPTHKKAKNDFDISTGDLNGAKEGDLVTAELLPSRGLKRKKVRITKVLGTQDDPKAISLISLHEAGLSESFPENVREEANKLHTMSSLQKHGSSDIKQPDSRLRGNDNIMKGREDLRKIPLVTIDGADARDFDDAVFAEKDSEDSFHLIVAIADVSYYVRFGSALDKEAKKRGNSTYFPDRVVPMLPEALSNDLCSLRPNEDRASMAVHLWIDSEGRLQRYKFVRALIKSAARLTYEQVQAAYDGNTDDTTGPLMDTVIKPLYEAYHILDKAREQRGALDLDIPERQIIIDDQGNMTGVTTRTRLDAHKLIEEFMILANVAAASALEKKNGRQKSFGETPCVYRVHDKPSYDKLESARDFLDSFNLSLPKGQDIKSKQINRLLHKATESEYSALISQVILRTQSQAIYAPDNIGHFGLALDKYAHFTSPIRRYADLLVHRALIKAYGLGPGGMDEAEKASIKEACEHITLTERNSMDAERKSVDRFTANYLSSHIGAEFSGKISGVTRFGLFITLDESGADGLIPMKSLGDDFYVHDEKAHALIGRRKGKIFRLGASLQVIIKEADALTGACRFALAPGQQGADIPGMTKPRIPKDNQKGRNNRKSGRNKSTKRFSHADRYKKSKKK
ncbi:MAG: ribonuclease R [Alphaproteobacteria bacterium]|nr:ribonuclease R [Alphaproteobacteria bacterium]